MRNESGDEAHSRLEFRRVLSREGADGVIGRSETRDTPRNPVATLEAAVMFGTRVAKPILARSEERRVGKERTYDRKRSDSKDAPPLAGRGPSRSALRGGSAPRPSLASRITPLGGGCHDRCVTSRETRPTRDWSSGVCSLEKEQMV